MAKRKAADHIAATKIMTRSQLEDVKRQPFTRFAGANSLPLRLHGSRTEDLSEDCQLCGS